MVQWLRFHAFTAGGAGLIPGWGNKIPQAEWPKKLPQSPQYLTLLHALCSLHFFSIPFLKYAGPELLN